MSLNETNVRPSEIEARRVEERYESWLPNYAGLGACSLWILREACVLSIRIEQARALEPELEDRYIKRATYAWDEDRRLAVEELAAGLARRPGLVASRLNTTKHGCVWLIERWSMLVEPLRRGETWTDAQRSLALDLLGIPLDSRDRLTPLDSPDEAAQTRLAIVESEIERLRRRVSGSLAALDNNERESARLGAGLSRDPAVRAHRTHVAACRRRLDWCLSHLDAHRQAAAPAPQPVADETKPIPPADLVEYELSAALRGQDIEDEDANLRIDRAMDAYLARAREDAPLPNRHARRAEAAMQRRG